MLLRITDHRRDKGCRPKHDPVGGYRFHPGHRCRLLPEQDHSGDPVLSAIRFEKVCKSYDDQVVLRDFDLEVRSAETKIVLGGSGSGKSTILKMVLGLVKPDQGRIWVNDQDVTDLSEDELMEIRKQIGMVFQEGALFDSITVGENVAYPLREGKQHTNDEIEAAVKRLLGFVGLASAYDKMPSELSGGMRRRVAIARAVVHRPSIVLYDEPTAGLDPITSRTICDLVIALRDLEGVSSIFVTHDLSAAMTLASEMALRDASGEVTFRSEDDNFCLANTRFVILKDGQIIFEGTDEALGKTDDEYVREFLT
ncbi:MAG: ATP-binding cassette domain-containing protein [Acidobacteria bacterium]|nr:MAG: ATP-binding cassette domain-containing protein [Acidobacteriota bacterium]